MNFKKITILLAAISLSFIQMALCQVSISEYLADASFSPISTPVIAANNTPNGGDFYVVVQASNRSKLGTYSQRINFNSNNVHYKNGYTIMLPNGNGKISGFAGVDTSHSNNGASSYIVVSGYGIKGQTSGAGEIIALEFEVVNTSGSFVSSFVDDPGSNGSFNDDTTQIASIAHSHGQNGVVLNYTSVECNNWNLYQ